MPKRRPPILALILCGLLCTVLGAGSVVAAASLPVVVLAAAGSALSDYDSDTPELKRADLARALVSNGASPDRIVLSYTNNTVDQRTLDRVHELAGGTLLVGNRALGREVVRVPTAPQPAWPNC